MTYSQLSLAKASTRKGQNLGLYYFDLFWSILHIVLLQLHRQCLLVFIFLDQVAEAPQSAVWDYLYIWLCVKHLKTRYPAEDHSKKHSKTTPFSSPKRQPKPVPWPTLPSPGHFPQGPAADADVKLFNLRMARFQTAGAQMNIKKKKKKPQKVYNLAVFIDCLAQ